MTGLFAPLARWVRSPRRRENAAEERIQTVSHDLRAPINATEGYLRFLLERESGPLTGEQEEILESALSSLRFMRRFIDEMLDLAKIEAGAMSYLKERTELGPVLTETAELFKYAAREKGIALSVRIQPGLAPVFIDRERVRQVVVNLVSNAIKFTRRGGVVAVCARSNSRRALVSVTDSGCGIPADRLRELFARFSRVELERSPEEKAEGTGLGLWIARGIVRGHDGDLWVDSKLGVGSTFQFTLPVPQEEEQ